MSTEFDIPGYIGGLNNKQLKDLLLYGPDVPKGVDRSAVIQAARDALASGGAGVQTQDGWSDHHQSLYDSYQSGGMGPGQEEQFLRVHGSRLGVDPGALNDQQQTWAYGREDSPVINGMADDGGQVFADSKVGGQTLDQLGLAEIVARRQQIEQENQQPTPDMTYQGPAQGGGPVHTMPIDVTPIDPAPGPRGPLQGMGGQQLQRQPGVTVGRQNQSVNPYQNQDLTNMHNTSRRGLLDDLFGRGGGLL